jgi:hypothetical protein
LDHACPGTPKAAAKGSALLSSPNTIMTKDKLLLRLKEWSLKRKSVAEDAKPKTSVLKGLIRTKSKETSTVVIRGQEIARLRKEAVGDNKLEESKRVYVHGEGPPNLTSSIVSAGQVLRKPVYFSKVFSTFEYEAN